MPRLTIKNGRIIDPANGVDQIADLVLDEGRVVSIGKVSRPDATGDSRVLDASGNIVCPGLIDVHVHFREPGNEEKETTATGAAAAVAGGFTSVCCMPNTQPALDDAGRIDFVYEQSRRANLANVYPVGAITKGRKGEELAEIGLMARGNMEGRAWGVEHSDNSRSTLHTPRPTSLGAVAFSDDGVAVASAAVMAKALAYVAMTGRPLMQHCEEPGLGGGAMNAGPLAARLGLAGWPRVAEELIIQRDILLVRHQNFAPRYHVQHLSSGGSVELIRRARADAKPQAAHVTAEVSPHHLLLTEDCCATYDPNFKMNPPLRTARDIEALLEGVADGTITILATDHAPHTTEEKELEFAAAPYGVIGLECALPLYIKALIDSQTIDWPRLIAMMTVHPAQLCNLTGKGTLSVGADADVTVIDPDRQWTIDVNDFAGKSRNCPFDGWNVTGQAAATIVSGEIKLARDPDRLKGGSGTPIAATPRELAKSVAA